MVLLPPIVFCVFTLSPHLDPHVRILLLLLRVDQEGRVVIAAFSTALSDNRCVLSRSSWTTPCLTFCPPSNVVSECARGVYELNVKKRAGNGHGFWIEGRGEGGGRDC